MIYSSKVQSKIKVSVVWFYVDFFIKNYEGGIMFLVKNSSITF